MPKRKNEDENQLSTPKKEDTLKAKVAYFIQRYGDDVISIEDAVRTPILLANQIGGAIRTNAISLGIATAAMHSHYPPKEAMEDSHEFRNELSFLQDLLNRCVGSHFDNMVRDADRASANVLSAFLAGTDHNVGTHNAGTGLDE